MEKENEWFAAETEAENGNRIIVRGRLFLNRQQESGRYPTRIEIVWNYTPDTQGMPENDELFRIDEQMNRLTDALEKDGLAILTAVYVGAGQSRFVFYIENLDRFSERLNTTLSSQPVLPIQIGADRDTGWSEYSAMLEQFGLDHKTS